MPEVKESIHKSLRKRRGLGSAADWAVQAVALGMLASLVVPMSHAQLAVCWEVVNRTCLALCPRVCVRSRQEPAPGPSCFDLSSVFCAAFLGASSCKLLLLQLLSYYFIIIFIIPHLDLCFTKDRILKPQVPRSRGSEGGQSLCLNFVSAAAEGVPGKVHPASSWPTSTHSAPPKSPQAGAMWSLLTSLPALQLPTSHGAWCQPG